jgi:hypothetical protein
MTDSTQNHQQHQHHERPQYYELTVQPGFPEFLDPLPRYAKRVNYGNSMTVYTIDNRISALLAKKRFENQGYVVHLEEPDGTTSITPHTKTFF